MIENFDIAGYCRISVDEEADRENTSIENQKAIIADFVTKKFPNSTLTFYEDRDKSGYTFEQRDGYQAMRPLLMDHKYDMLIVKDFSRFARRNSRGLVELEDLRDRGVRIISIGDSIDYPTYDDWTAIQFRFLINEMPVTDASKKVKSVIQRRQNDGKWICAVPYGYHIANSKTMCFEVDAPAAVVVQDIFNRYNEGWGYKKIANYLTGLHIPTPRMAEKSRKEEAGVESRRKARPEWSIATVQGILENDFYIGTLRQGKYTRKKINGADLKKEATDHIVFENNHPPIVDYRSFASAQEQRKKRTTSNYRGVKKHDNVYSGFLICGDCGSPMFSMSRRDLKPAYTCGSYHKRGLAGCTSHHTRTDILDGLLKDYVKLIQTNSLDMLEQLNAAIKSEATEIKHNEETAALLQRQTDDAYEELKATKRQRIRDIMKHPEKEELLLQTYDEMEAELEDKIAGLKNQLALTTNKRNTIIQVNRIAKTALDIFNEILAKDKLDKVDLDLIIDKITIYETRMEVQLKADIDQLLQCGTLEDAANFPHDIVDSKQTRIVQSATNRTDKVYSVSVISEGDPLEIYTDSNGGVIFKKYSQIGEEVQLMRFLCDAMFKATKAGCAISDRDHIVAACGMGKGNIVDHPLSPQAEALLNDRTARNLPKPVEVVDGDKTTRAAMALPIISGGDTVGLVFTTVEDDDLSTIQMAAQFLSKYFE